MITCTPYVYHKHCGERIIVRASWNSNEEEAIMRKRMLSAAMAGMMVVSMTACGGSKQAETTAAATEAETSAEETTAAETTAEAADEAGELGGTFTVGFEAIKETVKTKMELFGSIGKA